MSNIEYLDPKVKPLDDIARRLAAKVRVLPSGAKSLAHILAIVPTAESGRRLRAALARILHAAVPPHVVMPASLVVDDAEDVAGRTDELAAFMEALGEKASVDVAAQLSDVRAALGANALSFADVADRIPNVLKSDLVDAECERWRELAVIESRFVASLARRGKRDRIAAMKAALASPRIPSEVEEIVVACVLDPIPAMRTAVEATGLPCTEYLPPDLDSQFAPLKSWQVSAYGSAASECWVVAERFASVRPDEALPALCMADAKLYPEMQGALQAKGITLNNPSKTRLATSSLGHVVAQLAALKRNPSYKIFSSFIRGGDVRRWMKERLGISDHEYTEALMDLDRQQRELLPERIDDIVPKTRGKIRAIGEEISIALRKKGVREILRAVFSGYILDERNTEAREFAAAAKAVNELVDECFAPGIPENIAAEIFSRRLDEATYSLEPDEGEAVFADGWLEIPFLDADELYIAGFQEGCVPESIVGHAFLPDSLRKGLGLPSNESRAKRDLAILRIALACRAPGAVRVSFHTFDSAGDVMKPSRLLFACDDDKELLARVGRFYKIQSDVSDESAADLPRSWRLALDIPPERSPLERTSPSALDTYLECPFTYLLKKAFGEKVDLDAEELDPAEFGRLVHDSLEAWGKDERLRESVDAREISSFLSERIDAILSERFGTLVPAIVSLQAESAKRRLSMFAEAQAERRRNGWRVVATERKLSVAYGHTVVKGRCDRVDFCDATGQWCVIDYKTWDDSSRAEQVYNAKKDEWTHLQLPLYCAMLDADSAEEFADAKLEKITSCYCIIGESAEHVRFTEHLDGGLVPSAEAKIRELIDRIERGIFWPPTGDLARSRDFRQWIFQRPADSVSPDWIADQERRLEALASEVAQ